MAVTARCVAVYVVNKISDVFIAALQAVGVKTGPSSVCEKGCQGFGKGGF